MSSITFNVTFGLYLTLLRRRRHLTIAQLARKAGISRNALSLIEHDKGNPTLTTIMRLAKALDVKPGELVDGGEL